MAEDIQVAMATDRNYLDYALVAAASLLAQHPGGGITLHLLHEELDESDFARFEALRRIDGFRLVPRKIERGFFQGWPELRWSTSAYYRLILPSLLPDLEKILYLDCDLLVLDDIAKLWNTELGGRRPGGPGTPEKDRASRRSGLLQLRRDAVQPAQNGA